MFRTSNVARRSAAAWMFAIIAPEYSCRFAMTSDSAHTPLRFAASMVGIAGGVSADACEDNTLDNTRTMVAAIRHVMSDLRNMIDSFCFVFTGCENPDN